MLTQSDVEKILAHPASVLPRGTGVIGQAPNIALIQLMTRREAETMLGHVTLTDSGSVRLDTPVWYVELHGDFSGAHHSHPHMAQIATRPYKKAIAVFGADTGTILIRSLR